MSDTQRETQEVDVIVVGAGFAGMYMLYRLRAMGFSVRVLEAADGVGGTWYWNRYPGARCDVESMQYSYQFSEELQQEWEWSERYSPQPEILKYANHVADRFDLRRDIQFETRVESAHFNDVAGRWLIATEAGERYSARYCIMATGCLSSPNEPTFDGLDDFEGPTYHTGHWPHDGVDFSGQRVAVIGTGSSAIQSIPIIAEQAEQLVVFQRTANYAIPAHNAPLEPDFARAIKADYAEFRRKAKLQPSGLAFELNDASALEAKPEERSAQYEARWNRGGLSFLFSYSDLLFSQEANDTAADFVRAKIRETVDDPQIAELLTPSNIIGCKRLCIDIDYFQTYNRDNVTLIDINENPIQGMNRDAVRAGGVDYAVDAIVLATGFDAMTGALLKIDIRGRAGARLAQKWEAGPRSYLGLAVAGFPNLFTITGPGSPSVLTNMLPSIEQHVDWIAECLDHMRAQGRQRIEASIEAEYQWVGHNTEVAGLTLRSTCSSWYVGANIPGKPRVFMPYIGGFPAYVKKCEQVAAAGYEGFAMA